MVQFPDRNEMVVCKILRIMNYGVIAELLEYPGVEAFIHISEVASSWVKNIRNYVKENQIKVGKVLYIDQGKNHVDLSFTKVNESQERSKMNEYRFSKRSQKLIELVASKAGKHSDLAWKEVADPLIQEYGSLLKAFDKIKADGKAAAVGVPEIYVPALLDVVDKNIEMPLRILKGQFSIKSNEPDGLLRIKDSFLKLPEIKETNKEFVYLGGGKYLLKVSAYNFKLCERALKEINEALLSNLKAKKCEASFIRLEND